MTAITNQDTKPLESRLLELSSDELFECHPKPLAVGLAHMLVEATQGLAGWTGVIGRYPNQLIANACCWAGDADAFVEMMVDSGWLVESLGYRLRVKDWERYRRYDEADRTRLILNADFSGEQFAGFKDEVIRNVVMVLNHLEIDDLGPTTLARLTRIFDMKADWINGLLKLLCEQRITYESGDHITRLITINPLRLEQLAKPKPRNYEW